MQVGMMENEVCLHLPTSSSPAQHRCTSAAQCPLQAVLLSSLRGETEAQNRD